MLGLDVRKLDFRHPTGCNCCTPGAFEATLCDMSIVALDMALTRKADDLDGGEDIIPEDDPYLEYELAAAIVMAKHAEDFYLTAEEILQKPFYIPRSVQKAASNPNDAKYTARIEEVITAINETARQWSRYDLSTEDTDNLTNAYETAMAAGVAVSQATIGASAAVAKEIRQRIIAGMIKSSKYYTNQFFNTQVMPALVKAVEAGVALPGDNLIYSTIRQVLDTRLKTVPYWRLVANTAASRSYHYGLLKSALVAGRRGYQFKAIIDERTSDICRAMNGREWLITDAVNLIERIADAEPDDVKNIAPWMKFADVEPYLDSPVSLQQLGVIVPPLHGHCRSTLVIL